MQNSDPPNRHLIHKVIVEPTNENYHSRPFDADTIKGALRIWFTEKVQHARSWEMERVAGRRLLVFRFACAIDAAAFQRAWGLDPAVFDAFQNS